MLLNAADSLLLVIDLQTKLLASMDAISVELVTKNTRLLLLASKLLDVQVVRSEQYPQGLGGTQDDVATALPDSARHLEKTCFSCCQADGFGRELIESGKTQVVLSGVEAHICVLQTALELASQGLEIFVVEDATTSRSANNHQNAMARLRQAGVIVTNTESVLFEWLRDASHPHFRELSRQLR